MSKHFTVTVDGEDVTDSISMVSGSPWSLASSRFSSMTAASFGPGSKTYTIPLPVDPPRFKYGDVVRSRFGIQTLMVLAHVDRHSGGANYPTTYDCLPLDDVDAAATSGTVYYYEDEMEALDE